SLSELQSALEAKRPRRALLFIDACRDLAEGKGLGVNQFGAGGAPPASPQFAALYSCEPGEISREGKPQHFQNGVFTKFLLDGLGAPKEAGNAEGTVTFDSLSQFVRAKVFSYVSKEYGASQTPFGRTSFGGMVLARAFAAPAGPPVPEVAATPASGVPFSDV